MPDIELTRPHQTTIARAKAVVQKTADDLAAEYDLQSRWEGDTLHFSRTGVDGKMRVTAQDIQLEIKLGFLLRPFKAKFEENIVRHFDALLAAPTSERAATTPATVATTAQAPANNAAKATPKKRP